MKHPRIALTVLVLIAALALPAVAAGGDRSAVLRLAAELDQKASDLARSNLEHFRGWNGVISDVEQAALFKSEAFAASTCWRTAPVGRDCARMGPDAGPAYCGCSAAGFLRPGFGLRPSWIFRRSCSASMISTPLSSPFLPMPHA